MFCNEILPTVERLLVLLAAELVLFKVLDLEISFPSCGDVRTSEGHFSELSDVETSSESLSSEVDSDPDIYFMHSGLPVLSEGTPFSSVTQDLNFLLE